MTCFWMLNCNSQYVPEDSTELELRPGGVTGMFFGGSGGGTEKTVDRACSERSTTLLNIELNKDPLCLGSVLFYTSFFFFFLQIELL